MTCTVRYLREVTEPPRLRGREGLVRDDLEAHDAAQLVADGYAEYFGEQPAQQPRVECYLNGKKLVDVLSVTYVDSNGAEQTWQKGLGDEPGVTPAAEFAAAIEEFNSDSGQ